MGTLYLVSTPIGNLDDISIRALKVLFSADIIACEDTRRSGILLKLLKDRYGKIFLLPEVNPVLVSFYDQTEFMKIPVLISHLRNGKNIVLISDSGTPLISDPGFKLVSAAIKFGVKVTPVPGASALITALTGSGLPPDKFIFLGYPPEKSSHRIKLFNGLLSVHRDIDGTFIFYCPPHKLTGMLKDMQSVLGNIDVVLARELTKIHEEFRKGKISEILTAFSNPRGEMVILFNIKNQNSG